jgi:hypothetical protein
VILDWLGPTPDWLTVALLPLPVWFTVEVDCASAGAASERARIETPVKMVLFMSNSLRLEFVC